MIAIIMIAIIIMAIIMIAIIMIYCDLLFTQKVIFTIFFKLIKMMFIVLFFFFLLSPDIFVYVETKDRNDLEIVFFEYEIFDPMHEVFIVAFIDYILIFLFIELIHPLDVISQFIILFLINIRFLQFIVITSCCF